MIEGVALPQVRQNVVNLLATYEWDGGGPPRLSARDNAAFSGLLDVLYTRGYLDGALAERARKAATAGG